MIVGITATRRPAEAQASAPSGELTPGRGLKVLSWVLQILAAGILFQTLFFKFTAARESVYIFETLGMEPWGRIGSGVVELVACALLLIPRTVPWGAVIALGVISGALASHVTRLGLVVMDDGGLLFALAVTVFVCSTLILILHRRRLVRQVRGIFSTRTRPEEETHARNHG